VVGAQDPQSCVEDLTVFGFGVGGPALVGEHAGDLVPGGQGAGVVGAQDPQFRVEDQPELGFGVGSPALVGERSQAIWVSPPGTVYGQRC
jgi:hypothetical protein